MISYFLDASAFARLFVQGEGSAALIALMERAEDNQKLIAAVSPLVVEAAIRRRERRGEMRREDSETARMILRREAARMVQQPMNPATLEAAHQLIESHDLSLVEALDAAAAVVAREMFPERAMMFVSTADHMISVATELKFETLNPAREQAAD